MDDAPRRRGGHRARRSAASSAADRFAVRANDWEGNGTEAWRERWALPALTVFEEIGSTNDVARDAALEGAPAGTVFLAELQTAGRGRFGRPWTAPPASSLLLSVVLRPAAAPDPAPGTLPLRIGLAAADAIEQVAGVRTWLKWPNDLVAPGAGKLGGILCEAIATGDAWAIVAGIGINVRQRAGDWPAALRDVAASIDDVAGATIDRAALASALIERIRPLFTAPLLPLSGTELSRFAERDLLAGRVVDVFDDDRSADEAAAPRMSGACVGLAPDGALLIRTNARVTPITTGTVRIARPARSSETPARP